MSNVNWLDGVARTPLVPQLEVAGWDTFSFQYTSMYRDIYDAIMKIRAGEITLTVPTADNSFSPTLNTHLITKAFLAGSYIPKSILTAKGDLIVATAASTPSAVPSGADGKFLMAWAAEPAGVKWDSVHGRQHVITDTLDHTSLATAGKMLKADANGLPVEATNTDVAVAAAVTSSHTRAHTLDNTTDHSVATDNTNHNVSTTKHGLCPKLSGLGYQYLSGQGAFAVRPHCPSTHTTCHLQTRALHQMVNGIQRTYLVRLAQPQSHSYLLSTPVT